jgi:hypothetical protein
MTEKNLSIILPERDPCPFCDYLAGRRPWAFVLRSPLISSFVNPRQYGRGAALIIPNRHAPTILDLTPAELQAIPWLIRLRSAISTLWWLGRTDIRRNPGRVPGCIANQQEFVQWLAKYEPQFVAVLMAAANL